METGDGTGRSSFDPSPNTSGGFSQNNGSLRREIIAMQDDQPGNRGTFAIPETFREKPVRTLFKIHLPAKQGFLTIDYVATMNLKEVLQIVAKKRRLQTDGGSFSHLKSKEEIPLTTILGDLDVDCLKLRLPGLNNDDSIIDFHSGANAQRAPRDLNIQRSTFFSVPNLDSPSGSLTSTHATLRPNGSPSMNTSPPSSTTTSPNSTLRPEMNKKSSFIFPTIRAEIVQGDIAVVGPLPSEEPDLDESLVTLPPPPGSSNITSNRASHDSEDSFTITPLTHDPPPPSRDVIPEKKAMRPPLPARTANKTSQRPPIAPASSGNPSPARPSGPRPVRRPPMADSSAIVPTPPSTEWKSNPITEASPSGPIIGVMPRDSFFSGRCRLHQTSSKTRSSSNQSRSQTNVDAITQSDNHFTTQAIKGTISDPIFCWIRWTASSSRSSSCSLIIGISCWRQTSSIIISGITWHPIEPNTKRQTVSTHSCHSSFGIGIFHQIIQSAICSGPIGCSQKDDHFQKDIYPSTIIGSNGIIKWSIKDAYSHSSQCQRSTRNSSTPASAKNISSSAYHPSIISIGISISIIIISAERIRLREMESTRWGHPSIAGRIWQSQSSSESIIASQSRSRISGKATGAVVKTIRAKSAWIERKSVRIHSEKMNFLGVQ
eukprot:TRINITY_DN2163_c0_g1_i2.p1 TRINITY_DN2163_c0_g1~~TRINITY_DN2163_c0_g1_i2.p1  ORF type:complete len:659 (-),score=95.07 TRINITY_DN2163_c0_g1_i2:9-1985(-)